MCVDFKQGINNVFICLIQMGKHIKSIQASQCAGLARNIDSQFLS